MFIAVCLAVIPAGVLSQTGQQVGTDPGKANSPAAAQIIGTTKYKKYSLLSVSPQTREAFLNIDTEVRKQREELLEAQIENLLFSVESRKRGLTIEELKQVEVSSHVPDPTDEEIKVYYESNRKDLDNKPLEEVRSYIRRYLRRQAAAVQWRKFIAELFGKYTVKRLKDINATNLSANDVLVTIADDRITVLDYENENRAEIWGTRADAYEAVIQEVEKAMFTDLQDIEAKHRGSAAGEGQLEGTPGNLSEAEDKLKDKLFNKYHAKILLTRPEFVQDINVAEAPFKGSPKAAVTVVMFSDLQCPHCAVAHPMVAAVTAAFGNKVRFIFKNYPLTAVHPNAFRAAEAAAAAQAQGKFFEYIERLYKNQDALNDEQLKRYASDIGLDRKRFDESMSTGQFAPRIKADITEGEKLGLFGTPTVFVNGYEIYFLTRRNLRQAINTALRSAKR